VRITGPVHHSERPDEEAVMDISATSPSITATGSRPPHRGGHGGPMKAAAKALEMSQSDLETELKSGKSLTDVATQKGVSTDSLAAALKAGLPKDLPGGKADEIVGTMMSRKGGPQQPGHYPQGGDNPGAGAASGVFGSSLTGSQADTLSRLSSLLDTDSSSLLNSLKSGSSLSDLVSAKGIDSKQLAGVLQDGLLVDTKA
jgi:lambda repressor-like predicted transcriptional regulator